MKIININILKGPNYWSRTKYLLVVMKLDLEDLEYKPTNKIEGFYPRLKSLLPSLYNHHCSENKPGGFFTRVEEGTWMGHVIEHIALELQTLAGMDCGFGKTRSTKNRGIYNVVFNYKTEEAGLYAARASVAIAQALIENKTYNLENDLKILVEIRERNSLGPSTKSLIDEAIKRGIPFKRIGKNSFFQLGYGKKQKRIQATVTGDSSCIAVDLACDKENTKNLLLHFGIPVPIGALINSLGELSIAIEDIGYPLAIKPNDGNQGKGATINIKNWEEAVKAFNNALIYSSKIIVESFIPGEDFRILVVNNKFVAAAKRTPARVVGDGERTVQELIKKVNQDERRGDGHANILSKIAVDKEMLRYLHAQGMSLDYIPKQDEKVVLRTTANLSTGGTAENVTEKVHPFNILMAERIARTIGLDICGIDVITPDLSIPLTQTGGAVIEVNAAPGFRMHLSPTIGKPINVAAPVVDMLFPEGSSSRIPLIAITGTNGKTTTTRLIAHFAKISGYHVGCTTSDGVYINNNMIFKGDCTGPKSTEMVLDDPSVDFAVLECARGGILKSGLAFDQCDIGVVTNVTSDHLGLHDIDTLEDLAKVKSLIPETVHKDGFAVLNADDYYTYNMIPNLKCQVALFSMDAESPNMIKHFGNGGSGAFYDDGYLFIRKGKSRKRILHVKDIPLTFSGRATFMIENVLAAILAAHLSNISLEVIRTGLRSFKPSPEQTPGRMNLFTFKKFEVLVDYAHNPAGFKAIGDFLKKVRKSPKVGVIAGVGDRRNEDIIEVGKIAAQIFDKIIIRNDSTSREKDPEEIQNLLLDGIRSINRSIEVNIISTEEEAVNYIVNNAQEGSFIVFCTELVSRSIELFKKYLSEEDKELIADESFDSKLQ